MALEARRSLWYDLVQHMRVTLRRWNRHPVMSLLCVVCISVLINDLLISCVCSVGRSCIVVIETITSFHWLYTSSCKMSIELPSFLFFFSFSSSERMKITKVRLCVGNFYLLMDFSESYDMIFRNLAIKLHCTPKVIIPSTLNIIEVLNNKSWMLRREVSIL